MVVALFLAGAAAAERRWAQPALTLRGVPVAQAMSSPVATGPDWLTLNLQALPRLNVVGLSRP
jgi:hypothetical protein